MHIAFLDANTDRSEFSARYASEADKFRALMAPVAPDWQFTSHAVASGDFPATLDRVDGIMVSGSPASVNDTDPWIARLMATIRTAVAREIPVFGACFGHQAVAHALGGTVARNPQGWVLGRIDSRNHSPAPWMTDAAPGLTLHAAHNEQVVTPPIGARVLAGNGSVPHGHLAMGMRVFTTQYHPEFTPGFMVDLLEELRREVPPEVLAQAEAGLPGPVDSSKMATWIATFFLQAKG